MGYFEDKSVYNGNLKLQGSNDGWATIKDIYTVRDELHEGWNYYKLDELLTTGRP